MDKSRASHEQVMKNLLTSWDQDVSKLWTSHEKFVIKSCTKSEKDLGKLKRRHEVLSDYRFNSMLGRIPYGSTPGKASTYCIYPLLHCSHLQMLPQYQLLGFLSDIYYLISHFAICWYIHCYGPTNVRTDLLTLLTTILVFCLTSFWSPKSQKKTLCKPLLPCQQELPSFWAWYCPI